MPSSSKGERWTLMICERCGADYDDTRDPCPVCGIGPMTMEVEVAPVSELRAVEERAVKAEHDLALVREELADWQDNAMEHDDAVALAQRCEDRKQRIIELSEERDGLLAK